MRSERELRQDIVEVGRRIWQRGYVAANDGNISARLSETQVLATPTGVSKGFLTPEMLVRVDMGGRVLDGDLEPSSEIKLHLSIYLEREDVCGVVHAHPPAATGFAVAGVALDRPILTEIVLSLKAIPLAGYGTPGSEELSHSIKRYLRDYDAFLLANHGALTVGRDVYQAYYRLETIEQCAKTSLAARILGSEQTLAPPQVQRLLELREEMGIGERGPCLGCGICDATATHHRFVETCGSSTESALGQSERRNLLSERTEDSSPVTPASPADSGQSSKAASLRDDELREIVERVAREVFATDEGRLDAVWRE